MEKSEKKREIEILRLLFTIVVCLHHLRYCTDKLPYGGGYIAVDFFFIASGFYLKKNMISNSHLQKNNLKGYIKKRYMRLYKDYSLAFGMAFILNCILFDIEIRDNICGYIKEAFMIEFGCVDSSIRINPPDWYCGYLLLSSIIIYVFLELIKKQLLLIGIVCSIVFYVFLLYEYGHINIFPIRSCVISVALLRALAGQLVGVVLCELHEKISALIDRELEKKIKVLLIFVGIYLSYMMLWDNAYKITDYLVVILLAILFEGCQTIRIECLEVINEDLFRLISELPYVMFLNHYIVVKLFGYFHIFDYGDWKVVSFIYITIVIEVSLMMISVRNHLTRCMTREIKKSK